MEQKTIRRDRIVKKLKTEIRCDNLNAVKLANRGNFKMKSKILNRKCYYIQEDVEKENVCAKHIPSNMMTANCLTKPLSGPNLMKNVKKFMNTTSDKNKGSKCGVVFTAHSNILYNEKM